MRRGVYLFIYFFLKRERGRVSEEIRMGDGRMRMERGGWRLVSK